MWENKDSKRLLAKGRNETERVMFICIRSLVRIYKELQPKDSRGLVDAINALEDLQKHRKDVSKFKKYLEMLAQAKKNTLLPENMAKMRNCKEHVITYIVWAVESVGKTIIMEKILTKDVTAVAQNFLLARRVYGSVKVGNLAEAAAEDDLRAFLE